MATPNNQFRLRLYSNTPYNFIVDWGDGTSDVFNQTTPVYQGATSSSTQISSISASWPGITHEYATPGKYTIAISEITPGGFPGLEYAGANNTNFWDAFDEFNNDAKKVTKISQWGTPKWNPSKAMVNSFQGCINLKDVVTDGGTSTLSALTNFTQAWQKCTSLSSFDLIDTSNAININNAWENCTSLKHFPLLNFSKVTGPASLSWQNCTSMRTFEPTAFDSAVNFSFTWRGCSSLTAFPLINIPSCDSFDRVWESCTSLSSFPLIDTSKMTGRFYACWNNCTNLRTFPNLSAHKIYDFGYAWNNCVSLTSFPEMDVRSGTNFEGTWSNCGSLTDFPYLSTQNGINFTGAWTRCYKLSTFPVLDFSNAINLDSAWASCHALSSFPQITNTSNVKSFRRSWTTIDSNQWMRLETFPLIDTSGGTSFESTWRSCINLKRFPEIDTSSGINFAETWYGCVGLTAFPLLSTHNGTNFSRAWSNCTSLSSFPTIDVSKGQNFSYTWANCTSLSSFPPLDFSSGTTFNYTWYNCQKLSADDFPVNLDTSKATSFRGAFASLNRGRDTTETDIRTSPLKQIPNFLLNPSNTSKTTDFVNTWRGCANLETFPSNINMLSANTIAGAWGDCLGLASFPNIMLSSVQIFGNKNDGDALSYGEYGFGDGGFFQNGTAAENWTAGAGAWMNTNFTSFPTLCTQNGTLFDFAWFRNRYLKEFPNINTSKGTSFYATWRKCFSLSAFPELDFSNADILNAAFSGLISLKQFPQINTSKCRYFGGAWFACSALNTFPEIDTLSATSFYDERWGGAWQNCISLTAFPMLNTSNCTNFKQAWMNCYSLSSSPFPQLDMSKMSSTTNGGYWGVDTQGGTGGRDCFKNVTLQTHSWSSLLTSLCATNFNNNVQFHGGNSKRNAAGTTAFAYLTSVRNWSITDGGAE